MDNALWALLIGVLSTIALPIGAVVGIATKPSPRVAGALAGFGAGALFAALSIELIAPRMLGGGEHQLAVRIILLLGAAAGGITFTILDALLNSHGGYLRKIATTILYISHRKAEKTQQLMNNLAQSSFFRSIPPEQIHLLVDRLRETSVPAGEILFHQGDVGDRMFIIEDGVALVTRDGNEISRLGAGDI